MVYLFKPHASVSENLLDSRGMGNGVIWVRVERFDHRANAAPRNPRPRKTVRILLRQESSLDAYPPGGQELAQLQDARLSLVGGHQVGQFSPSFDQCQPAPWIGLDVSRGSQRHRNARAGGADRPQRGCANGGLQGLTPARVVRVNVQRPGAGINSSAGLPCNILRGPRSGRMLAVTVQRGLQQRARGPSHSPIVAERDPRGKPFPPSGRPSRLATGPADEPPEHRPAGVTVPGQAPKGVIFRLALAMAAPFLAGEAPLRLSGWRR
jgi:hypothetical protein